MRTEGGEMDADADATTMVAAQESGGRVRQRRAKTATHELRRLRVLVARLQLQLKSLERRRSRPEEPSQMEKLWRVVAASQAREREAVESRNAELRRSVQEQKHEAQCLLQLALNQIRLLTHGVSPLSSPIRPRVSVAEFLEQRLVSIYAQSLLQPVLSDERVGKLSQEHHAEPTVFGGLQVHVREEHVLPFKLSTVAQQCWELTLVDSLLNRCHLFEEIQVTATDVRSPLWLRVDRPYGGFEVHGGVLLRRLTDHNGDAVILLSSIAFACGGDPNNLMTGFVVLEEAWCRVRRWPKHTAQPLVHFESVGTYEIRPLNPTHPSNESRLHKLVTFLQRQLQDDSDDQAQRLENRLLEASAAATSAGRKVRS